MISDTMEYGLLLFHFNVM